MSVAGYLLPGALSVDMALCSYLGKKKILNIASRCCLLIFLLVDLVEEGIRLYYYVIFYDIIKTAAENSNICAARPDEDKI